MKNREKNNLEHPETTAEESSRRGFLRGGVALGLLGLTAVAGVCLCSAGGCKRNEVHIPVVALHAITLGRGKVSIDIDQVEPLQKVGGAARLVHPRIPHTMIIARYEDNAFAAVSDHCTHRGGQITYRARDHLFVCSNYGHSVFRLSGQVVHGPAPRPLPSYRTLLVGHTLEVFI